jgi:hypothetical protein
VAAAIVGFCAVDVKLLGPVQLYVAPAVNVAVKLSVEPAHKVELLPAVGADGIGLTVALVIPGGPVHPLKDMVTEYAPVAAIGALTIVGFCAVEVKLLGPVQLQVSPPLFVAVRLKVEPTHKGELFPTVGAEGVVIGMTDTVRVIAGQLEAVSWMSTV